MLLLFAVMCVGADGSSPVVWMTLSWWARERGKDR